MDILQVVLLILLSLVGLAAIVLLGLIFSLLMAITVKFYKIQLAVKRFLRSL